jgi:hypothetical protein
MKKSAVFILLVMICVLTACLVQASPMPKLKTDAPLPKEINLVTPAADVAPELAAFSGIWLGTYEWNYYADGVRIKRDVVIVAEKITGNKLDLVFAFGEMRPYYRNSNVAWKRVSGIYDPATRKVVIRIGDPLFSTPGTATIWLAEDGSMSILRKMVHTGTSDYTGVLKKQTL